MDLVDYGIDTEEKEYLEARSALTALWNVEKRNMDLIQITLVNYFFATFHIITLKDTEEVLIYNHSTGLWEFEGKIILKAIIGLLLPEISTHYCNEIIEKIRRQTYHEREILNPKNCLGVKNGVIYFNSFNFASHDPSHYLTTSVNAEYNEDSQCPLIINHLVEVIKPKDLDILLEAMAYTLYPDYHIHKAFFLVGVGANGKDTTLTLLETLLGEDSVSNVPLQDLVDNRFMIAELYNKKANIFSDLDEKAVNYTGIFKAATGNSRLKGEFKRLNPFYFRSFAKMFYSMNKIPPIYRDDTLSIWRRIVLFEFSRIFRDEEQDPLLIQKLTTKEELSGLLNLLLVKLESLLKRGYFKKNDAIEITRIKWKLGSNSAQAFCELALSVDMQGYEFSEDLYEEYRSFCHLFNVEVRSKQSLTKTLPICIKETKNKRKKRDGKQRRAWLNIRVDPEKIETLKSIILGDTSDSNDTNPSTIGLTRAKETHSTENVSFVSLPSLYQEPKLWKEDVLETLRDSDGEGMKLQEIIDQIVNKRKLGIGHQNRINKAIDELMGEGLIFSPVQGEFKKA